MRRRPHDLAVVFAALLGASACASETPSIPLDAGPDVVRIDAGRKLDSGVDAQDAADAGCGPLSGETTTDPENCGACGHSCWGGACKASVCQPFEDPYFSMDWISPGSTVDFVVTNRQVTFVLPTDIQSKVTINPYPLGSFMQKGSALSVASVSSSTAIYALTNGDLRTIRFDGTGDALVYATGSYTIWGVAVAGNQLFWTDYSAGTVSSCIFATCASTAAVIYTASLPPARGLAVSGGSLYVTLASSIVRMALDGTGAASFLDLPSGQEPFAVALDANHLYFTIMDSNTNTNYLRMCDVAKCATTIRDLITSPFLQGSQMPSALGVDSLNAYFSDRQSFFRVALPL